MKDIKKASVMRFLLERWLEKIGYVDSAYNMLFYGEPLVFNKKTGKWSNSLPTSHKGNRKATK